MPQNVQNIVIDWADVKHKFIACVERGERWPSQPMDYKFQQLYKDPYGEKRKKDDYYYDHDSDWDGGTGADTLKWLREGYHAPEFAHAAEMVPVALKARNVWNEEEGDIDSGRLLGGYDDFFLGSQKRLSKPGLRVQVEFAFAWTVSSKTIQEYGAWVAGFLGALETSGFDLVVDLWIPLDGLFQGDYSTRTNVLMRVKRPNEVSDFTEWSAIFAPTGYRQLGFTAKCVAGDKIGKTVTSSFGMTIGGKTWGVDYQPEEANVMITVNQRAGGKEKFPKDKLNKEAIECGLLPRPENWKG